MNKKVRTRFAPSPTGYLHIGGARTALFSWGYARHCGGDFILRIEDTDLERSTQASVEAILQGMQWLGLDYDEGPFYQTHRFDRYKAVIDQLLASGHAYRCYTTKEELEAMREAQRLSGEKPRYDGRCRDLTAPPDGVTDYVIRFKNPLEGEVVWQDLVKGEIRISNQELDDLIIARADGSPTYNFCVVVDDWDMGITHVIRGDDHVNNTPRQINILKALGAEVPLYGHVPMILGQDGERLSKRHGAVSVMQYAEEGFLPAALLNYLARLGWSHGDDEIFSMDQMVQWFDLTNINRAAAQFDMVKLRWINGQYLKNSSVEDIVSAVRSSLSGVKVDWLTAAVETYRDRSETLCELTDQIKVHLGRPDIDKEVLNDYLTTETRAALDDFFDRLTQVSWEIVAIADTLKAVLKDHRLKMPALAMPIRLMLTGKTHAPSVDRLIFLTNPAEIQTLRTLWR